MLMSCNAHGARENAAAPFKSLYFPGSAAPLLRAGWGPLRSCHPFSCGTGWGGALFSVLKCARWGHLRTASPLNHIEPWRDVQDCSQLDGNNWTKPQPAPTSPAVHPPAMSPRHVPSLRRLPVAHRVAVSPEPELGWVWGRGEAGVAAAVAGCRGSWLAGAAFQGLPAARALYRTARDERGGEVREQRQPVPVHRAVGAGGATTFMPVIPLPAHGR